jgi:hypothetical protein
MNVRAIHDIEGPRLTHEIVESVDVVSGGFGDGNKTRNGTAQIQQRVHFHRSRGGTESRPGKKAQTDLDDGGVEGVDGGVGQFHPKAFLGIKLAGAANQKSRDLGVDAPVPLMVGLSQRAAANPAPQAETVKMFGPGTQAKFEIA